MGPLTLPVAPRASPGQARRARGARTASTAAASTTTAFPARSAFHRHVLRPHSQAAPATDLATLPPRSGFRRSFTPPMLSHEEARPLEDARALHPGTHEDHAPRVDFCNQPRSTSTTARSTRTPLTAPRVAPERSSIELRETAFAASPSPRTGSRASFEAQPAETSRVRGERGENPTLALSPTISRGASRYPNPISSGTLCRNPASTRAWSRSRR